MMHHQLNEEREKMVHQTSREASNASLTKGKIVLHHRCITNDWQGLGGKVNGASDLASIEMSNALVTKGE
jgi:hypothetical protein